MDAPSRRVAANTDERLLISTREGAARSWSLNSGVLHASAIGAYRQAGTVGPSKHAAIAAIMLSATSVEAFVNELARIAVGVFAR
jgi:hypothetical protein